MIPRVASATKPLPSESPSETLTTDGLTVRDQGLPLRVAARRQSSPEANTHARPAPAIAQRLETVSFGLS